MTASDGIGPTSDAVKARAESYAAGVAEDVHSAVVRYTAAVVQYVEHTVDDAPGLVGAPLVADVLLVADGMYEARLLLETSIARRIASAFYIGHGAGMLERRGRR